MYETGAVELLLGAAFGESNIILRTISLKIEESMTDSTSTCQAFNSEKPLCSGYMMPAVRCSMFLHHVGVACKQVINPIILFMQDQGHGSQSYGCKEHREHGRGGIQCHKNLLTASFHRNAKQTGQAVAAVVTRATMPRLAANALDLRLQCKNANKNTIPLICCL